jgi:hypothetical protein
MIKYTATLFSIFLLAGLASCQRESPSAPLARTMTVNGKTIELGCPIGLGTIFKYQGKTYRVNGVSMGMSDAGMYGKKLNDPSEIGLGDVSEINPAAMKLCKK